jgi:hypothetical protein
MDETQQPQQQSPPQQPQTPAPPEPFEPKFMSEAERTKSVGVDRDAFGPPEKPSDYPIRRIEAPDEAQAAQDAELQEAAHALQLTRLEFQQIGEELQRPDFAPLSEEGAITKLQHLWGSHFEDKISAIGRYVRERVSPALINNVIENNQHTNVSLWLALDRAVSRAAKKRQ